MTVRIVRACAQRAMPWKNGGGITFEVAVFPEAASLQDFAWRVSMARVAADGPFSLFPGVDRSLAILDGAGITMHMGSRGDVALDRAAPPVSFAGEWPISATLRDGPVIDLNAMTRRGRWRHAMMREKADGRRIVADAEVVLLVVAGGEVALGNHPGVAPLAFRDVVVLLRGEQTVLQAGSAELFRVELSPVS